MLPLLVAGLAIVGIGMLSGCGGHCPIVPPPPSPPPEKPRRPFPEDPDAGDIFAHAPCAVKTEPDIVFEDSLLTDDAQQRWKTIIQGDLVKMRKIDPTLLCALERIEVMEGAEMSSSKLSPDSAVLYHPEDRSIGIRRYATGFLFHAIGHHLHNLGVMAPLVRNFREISWRQDVKTQEWKPIEASGKDFISEDAKRDFREDWAETFAFATSGQISIGLDLFIRKKLELLHRQIPFPLPTDPP